MANAARVASNGGSGAPLPVSRVAWTRAAVEASVAPLA